jgi:hypothetical protein
MFRPFTIAVLILGAWLGMKAERFLQVDRCLDAGGAVDTRGICTGVPRP